MLLTRGRRIIMKTLVASLALAITAGPAMAGPDFVTPNPRPRALAPSDSAREIAPFDDIIFDYDSHALGPLAQQQLAAAASWMKRHPRFRLVIEGYTDRSGHAVYNEDLATRRAAIARNHLIALGVPGDRLLLVVYGETAAHRQIEPLDRRVILYATDRPAREIAELSVDRKGALSAVWTVKGTLYTEARAGRRTEVVGRR
jgi:peptidoglycan-associated lipoprotein